MFVVAAEATGSPKAFEPPTSASGDPEIPEASVCRAVGDTLIWSALISGSGEKGDHFCSVCYNGFGPNRPSLHKHTC